MNTSKFEMPALIQRLLSRKDEKGFTLLELIIVVVVISVLTSISVPVYSGMQDDAKTSAVHSSTRGGVQAAYQAITENRSPYAAIVEVNNQTDKIELVIGDSGDNGDFNELCIRGQWKGSDIVAYSGLGCDNMNREDIGEPIEGEEGAIEGEDLIPVIAGQ